MGRHVGRVNEKVAYKGSEGLEMGKRNEEYEFTGVCLHADNHVYALISDKHLTPAVVAAWMREVTEELIYGVEEPR